MKLKNSYFVYVLMYFSFFVGYALLNVLTGLYLKDNGHSSIDISLVISSGLITSILLNPVIGYINDIIDKPRNINIFLALLGAVSAIGFLLANHLFFLAATYALSFSLLNSLSNVFEKKATLSPFRYGNIRIWGSIGFAFGSQLSGMLYQLSGGTMIYIGVAISVVLCCIGYALTLDSQTDKKIRLTNTTPHNAWKQFNNWQFITYSFLSTVIYAALNVSATHLPAMFESVGVNTMTTSTIIAIAVLIEMPFIFFSHKFMDKIASKWLLGGVFICLILKFFIYAFVPIVPLKIIVTLLFKHTVGMIYIMTNLKVIRNIVKPDYQSTALAVIASLCSIGSVVFQTIGGSIIAYTDYTVFYGVLAGINLFALCLLVPFQLKDNKQLKLFE